MVSVLKEYPLQFSLLGFGVLATAGALYMQTNSKKANSKKFKQLSREKVLDVLKSMNKEFYSVFSNLAMISNQIKEQTQGKITPAELREVLLNQAHFTKEVEEMEEKIYQQHNITRKDFKNSCLVTFKGDQFLFNLTLVRFKQ